MCEVRHATSEVEGGQEAMRQEDKTKPFAHRDMRDEMRDWIRDDLHDEISGFRHDLCELADRLDVHICQCPPGAYEKLERVPDLGDEVDVLANRLDAHIATGSHAPEVRECAKREWPKTLGDVLPGRTSSVCPTTWTLGWNDAVREMEIVLRAHGLLDAPIERWWRWADSDGLWRAQDRSHRATSRSVAVIIVPWDKGDC